MAIHNLDEDQFGHKRSIIKCDQCGKFIPHKRDYEGDISIDLKFYTSEGLLCLKCQGDE